MEYDTRRRRRRRRREENSVGRSTCARGGTSVSSELPDVFSTLAVAFRFIRALCAFDLAIARHVLRLLRPPLSLLLLSSLSPNPSSSRSHDSLIFSPRLARCAVCTSMHRARNNRRTKDTRRGKRGRASSFSSFFSFFFYLFLSSLSLAHTHTYVHIRPSKKSRDREGLSRAMLFLRSRSSFGIGQN